MILKQPFVLSAFTSRDARCVRNECFATALRSTTSLLTALKDGYLQNQGDYSQVKYSEQRWLHWEHTRRKAYVGAGLVLCGGTSKLPSRYIFFPCGIPLEHKRGFSGRLGGMKRKKQKRIPPYVQIGFGRLIEFFQSKHRPSRQTYMYQNVRTHLVNDTYRRRWLVYWYHHGLQEFRSFSYKGRPMEFVSRNHSLCNSCRN